MELTQLLERTLPALGYELVDLELSPKARLLRVFIDKPGGVDVEDCAMVSNHLTHLLTVENIDYDRLEVSSPGLDRALTKPADYTRFSGEEVQLSLRAPLGGRKRVKGVLRGLEGDVALVETAQGILKLPLSGIERARLVPKLNW